MRILITGGFGYLGTRFIEKFGNEHELITFVKNKQTDNQIVKNVKIEEGRLEDNKTSEIIKKYKPDVVIHLASLTGLKKCEENPHEAFTFNVFGSYNIIKTCLETKSKLVFTSSREVYGNTVKEFSSENDSLAPKNVYGITKMLVEGLIQNYNSLGLNYTILRITNVIGPGLHGKGLNLMIKDAVQNKRVQINGGEQIVNVIFIDDVIDVLMQVCENESSLNQIFNVGSKDNLTISNFANKISQFFDEKIRLNYMKRSNVENSVFKPDITKLQQILKFSNTTIENGLEKTIAWYKKNLN